MVNIYNTIKKTLSFRKKETFLKSKIMLMAYKLNKLNYEHENFKDTFRYYFELYHNELKNNKQLDFDKEDLKNTINDLEIRLETQDETIKKLQKIVHETQTNNQLLMMEKDSIQESKNISDNKVVEFINKINKLESELNSKKTEIRNLNKSNVTKTFELKNQRSLHYNLIDEYQENNELVMYFSDKMEEKSKQVDDLTKELEKYKAKFGEL